MNKHVIINFVLLAATLVFQLVAISYAFGLDGVIIYIGLLVAVFINGMMLGKKINRNSYV